MSCKVGLLPRLKINNQLLLAELEIRTKQYVQNLVQWMKKKTHKTFFPPSFPPKMRESDVVTYGFMMCFSESIIAWFVSVASCYLFC